MKEVVDGLRLFSSDVPPIVTDETVLPEHRPSVDAHISTIRRSSGEITPMPRARPSVKRMTISVVVVAAAVVAATLVVRPWRSSQRPAELPAAAPPAPQKHTVVVPDDFALFGPADFSLGWGGPEHPDGPAHPVSVGRFALSKHEVTVEQYRAFAETTGITAPFAWDGVDNFAAIRALPVNLVTQKEASQYCAWKYPRFEGRLPTEIEWEFAARDGTANRFPWGERFEKSRANAMNGRRPNLQPVDSLVEGRSPGGLSNLIGNVAEWTDSPALAYPRSTVRPVRGVVVRGGGADTTSLDDLTATSRRFVPADLRDPFIGFRCALTPP